MTAQIFGVLRKLLLLCIGETGNSGNGPKRMVLEKSHRAVLVRSLAHIK